MESSDRNPRLVRSWLALGLTVGFAVLLISILSLAVTGTARLQFATWQTALLTAFASALTMLAWRLHDEDRIADDSPARLGRAAAAVLAPLLLGLVLSRGNAAAVIAVVCIALTWAIASLVRVLELKEPLIAAFTFAQHSARSRWQTTVDSLRPSSGSSISEGASIAEPTAPPATLADEICFLLQRRSGPDGDAIDVQARLEFPAGAVEAVLHVPFWPALVADPVVECEPLDADEVDLRITSAERYGIRLEGRLPSAATEKRTVLIGIEIHTAAGEDELSAAA